MTAAWCSSASPRRGRRTFSRSRSSERGAWRSRSTSSPMSSAPDSSRRSGRCGPHLRASTKSMESTDLSEAPVTRVANEAASDAPVRIDPRARTEILIAVLLAVFLSALDQTIVGTALPRIVDDLKGNEFYTWVVTIYLLTATISGPIYGKLSDLFGRRPMVMFGVSLFLIGSALSGISQEMWQLVAARGLQGLGAGAIFPIALAVIGDLFTPTERGKYQGLFGAVFGISALIGPALGGFLTDNFSWHWVFFVNLPIGAVALVIIWRLLPPIRHPERARSIDYLGSVVFAAALVPLPICPPHPPTCYRPVPGSGAAHPASRPLPFRPGLNPSPGVSGKANSRTGRYRWLIV